MVIIDDPGMPGKVATGFWYPKLTTVSPRRQENVLGPVKFHTFKYTIAWRYDVNKKTLRYAVAIASDKEQNTKKEVGRQLAVDRLRQEGCYHEFRIQSEDPDKDLPTWHSINKRIAEHYSMLENAFAFEPHKIKRDRAFYSDIDCKRVFLY